MNFRNTELEFIMRIGNKSVAKFGTLQGFVMSDLMMSYIEKLMNGAKFGSRDQLTAMML